MHAESFCTIGAEAISVICPFSLFLFLQIFMGLNKSCSPSDNGKNPTYQFEHDVVGYNVIFFAISFAAVEVFAHFRIGLQYCENCRAKLSFPVFRTV